MQTPTPSAASSIEHDTFIPIALEHFGEARAHHAYLFANRRANRIKLLVHDGIGSWLCARRLQQGRFIGASSEWDARLTITMEVGEVLDVLLEVQRHPGRIVLGVSYLYVFPGAELAADQAWPAPPGEGSASLLVPAGTSRINPWLMRTAVHPPQ